MEQVGNAMARGAAAVVPLPVKSGIRRVVFIGRRFECPVCGARLRRWLEYRNGEAVRCPVCASRRRHRLMWWFLVRHERLFGSPVDLLHWAPELGWEARLQRLPGVRYRSADLVSGRAMLRLDITAIDLPDQSVDLTLCSHVLEHVPDDRAALRELYRVVRPAGHALVLVPLGNGPTDEDPSIADPEERRRRFGQVDHVRRYNARDLCCRLEEAGFRTTALRADDLLPTDQQVRFGLAGHDVLWWAERPAGS